MKYLRIFENHKLYKSLTSTEYLRCIDNHTILTHSDRNLLETKSDELGCELNIAQVGSTHRMLARFLLKDDDNNRYPLIIITKVDDDYYLMRVSSCDDIFLPESEHYKCDQVDGLNQFFRDKWNMILTIKKEIMKTWK